jgi:ketosteroid isomerase-like protein
MAQKGEIVLGARIAVPPLTDKMRQHRTLDQRLTVRFPALYRLLVGAMWHVSPRSRLRRSMFARTVALAYAAANRRDFEVVLVGMDLEIYEYRPSRDLMPLDMEAVFYGQDGYLRLFRYWLGAFGDIRWEPEEILDFGDRFLVTTQQRGRGSGSGVIVSEPVFQLFTVRRGLIVRQEDFLDRSEALEAAGGAPRHPENK